MSSPARKDRRTFLKEAGVGVAAASMRLSAHSSMGSTAVAGEAPGAVRAVEFESRQVYRSPERPGYACWVSFFPGEHGQWYLTCEQVTKPAKPYPRMTVDQTYAWSLPSTY